MKKRYALGGTNLPEITATAPKLKSKPKWETVDNTISFIKDGKKQYSTSDKIEELFPEYSTMKSAGVSDGIINTILKQKYSLEEKGKTEVMVKPKIANDTIQKPKYFLGAVLGGAQLAMSAINMIQQNKMQKEQVAKENDLIAEQDALAMKQKLDIEDVNQRNFGVNTPMHSFYANGGVKPTATNISTVVGPKHEQGGVDYKNAEVEGGEVIKHEGDNDFIFTDDMRIPFDEKHTYAEVAKQLSDDKGMLEKVAGAELLKHDKFIAKLNKSGSITEASTNKRKAEVAKFKADAIDKDVKIYDSKLEELKIDQLQKGMALGLYNEDGTPKDTKGEFRFGSYVNGVWNPNIEETNPYEIDDEGIGYVDGLDNNDMNDLGNTKSNFNLLKRADNFMGSNQGT